jgi:FtsH-binding integral membrane protein
MNASQAYILVSIITLFVVAILVFLLARSGQRNRLTPLAGIAFAFVLAGILFGENRLVGYSLMGIGIVLAIADMVQRSRSQ